MKGKKRDTMGSNSIDISDFVLDLDELDKEFIEVNPVTVSKEGKAVIDTSIFLRDWVKLFTTQMGYYTRDLSQRDFVTYDEAVDTVKLCTFISETTLFKRMIKFLRDLGFDITSVEILNEMYVYWFDLYSRNKSSSMVNSCGFAHIFCGEIRDGELIGLHSWIGLMYTSFMLNGEVYFSQHHIYDNFFLDGRITIKKRGEQTNIQKNFTGMLFGKSAVFNIVILTALSFLHKNKISCSFKYKSQLYRGTIYFIEGGDNIASSFIRRA